MTRATLIVAETSPFATVPAVLGMLLAVAALIGLIAVARKRLFNKDDAADDATGGLTLGGMRDLVRQGKMTQEEFDQTKAQIVAATQRKAERDVLEVKPTPRPPARGDSDGIDATGGGLL